MRLTFTAAAALIAVFGLAGCSGSTWGIHRELDNGRKVGTSTTRLARKMSVEPGFESTTVRIGPRTVRVEPDRVEIEGRRVAKIDETTECVIVSEVFDRLEIVADGNTVHEEPFTSPAPASAPAASSPPSP